VVRWFVDGYIANSKTVKQRVQALEHVPEHKIRVIHNGYSMEDVAATDCAAGFETVQGDCVIGIVANLRPIKRIDTLLTAFALVRTKYSNARLVIVGDTSSEQARSTREQLHALARELRITDAVVFTGSVSNARALIQKFSVAVLCSESEGMSNALIEYMRMRRPIVCTNTGGNPELVQHGHNGFLFPVGDAHALAKHLLALLGDRALARQFGEAGYAITASYTVSRMVDQHMAYYDEVLRGSHRSSSTEGRSHSHRARCISRAPTPRE
jgi:glycosyltransferase involved in cell wall biosynthesis